MILPAMPGLDEGAEAWIEVPTKVSVTQLHLIEAAAVWARFDLRQLATLIANATGVHRIVELTETDFHRIMDIFVACGFRHPAVPLVTAA